MKNEFDIIIIGLGPAGVSACLYTQRANMDTLLIGSKSNSLEKADVVENYYGLSPSLSGKELFENGLLQVENVGATIYEDQVVGISWDGLYTVKTTQKEFTAKAVIIATGTKRTALRIENLAKYEGKGVSYCAVCDGFFYKDKKIVVVGNGEYAHEEAKELLEVSSDVTILTNGEKANKKQGFKYDERKIISLQGDEVLRKVVFENDESLDISGMFFAIGTAGATDLATKLGAEIKSNSIVVDDLMQTNLPGLYAAGDTTGGVLQIAKAVYQGMVAGTSALKFVRGLKK